ncbi:hypothetical protein [Pseudomonas sp. 18175]|uniref:hypothetical protein n=1 Tax=Pseudomonas sp. 18175 TaxID=3390056 RepID=UPI003D1AD934
MNINNAKNTTPPNNPLNSGELFLIDRKRIVPLPWEQWADEIIQEGYSIITLTPSLQIDFIEMQKLIGQIPFHDRTEFSFVDRSDGFTPIGYSHTKEQQNTDLCETFNYWKKHKNEHKNYPFSNHAFYSHIDSYESQISIYGQTLINEILKKFDYPTKISVRDDSFLQFNYYREDLRSNGLKYLQQQHEDGHLLTIIKPNSPGLVLYIDDRECLVDVARDQAIVIPGSLLTLLSEGKIAPTYHAVINFTLPTPRCSVVYNINVLSPSLAGMISGADLKIFEHANAHHQTFGFHPLKER